MISLSGTFTDTLTPIPIKVMTLEGVSAERSDPIYGLLINWINYNTGKIIAYVFDIGYGKIGDSEISSVYVNGTMDSSATIEKSGNFWAIILSEIYEKNPQQLTLKVVTSQGAYDELTMKPYTK